MKAPIRVVCVECLQSLEYSSSDEKKAPATCRHCNAPIDLARLESEASTGEAFLHSSFSDHSQDPTPKVATRPKLPPEQVDRFLIREPLGEGGYGQVYRAYDPHLDRDIALKVLKPNRLGDKALERFFREARAAARLDHPNIVGLHDAGRDDTRCWIAYQLVFGRTLSMIRDLDRPSVDTSVRIIRDLALALDHAHSRGVFHRDLKPANVLVDVTGRPRLTDFGLARREDVDSELTREGTILGTPQYMSPEAAAGRAHLADARSDIYSLGVILYELICGKKPMELPSNAPLWRSTRITTPVAPSSVVRSIPAALDRICMKALAFDPANRYPDARSLASALDRYLQGRPNPDPLNLRRKSKSVRGRITTLFVVFASALSVFLGMSLQVASPSKVNVASASVLLPALSPSKLPPRPLENDKPAGLPEPSTSPALSKPFVGGDERYHSRFCRFLPSPNHRVEFVTAEEAEARGLVPCKKCKPPSGITRLANP